jgi:iron complex outermembrane recepter protein
MKISRLSAGLKGCASLIVLAALTLPAISTAQQTSPNPPQKPAEPSADADNTVTVIGTRASLQSAIDRKKKANTTVDSIVAEDVAQFPDKNIGEALQRVTGVSLQRDFGEGAKVSIRGVEPDLNRVEINGLSVLSNDGSGGRSVSFQELASELVASVDVFKGYTADMTEGGIGGTVSIKTRKPLDLRKPLLSVTGSLQYLDLTETTKFRGNITMGRKFFNNRLGVLLNITTDDNDTRADFLRGTIWSRFATSATASGDYDNSTEKTYTDPLYASATVKSQCGAASTAAGAACLNQWNDFVPLIPRYGLWARQDKRTSAMATIQYRVNNNLSVYTEYQINDRKQHLDDYNFQFTATTADRINALTYDAAGNPIARYPGATKAVVDSDHNLIDFYMAPYATSASTGTANNFTTQNRSFDYAYRSEYFSAGFDFKTDALRIEGILASTSAKSNDETNALTFNASIPNIRVQLSPTTGAPIFTAPTGYSFSDPATYGNYALTSTGAASFTTAAISSEYRPSETDATEDMLKLDADWNVDAWIFNKFETGVQYRTASTLKYAPAGYTTFNPSDPTRAPIYVQSAYVNYGFNLTPGLTVSGPTQTLFTGPAVTQTTLRKAVTPADVVAFIRAASTITPNTFYGSGDNPGINIPANWFTPDYNAAVAAGLLDTSLYNHAYVRSAPGRDAAGNIVGTFPQLPTLNIEETVSAWYGQGSFEFNVLGKALSGNAGVRLIKTEISALGAITSTYRTVSGGTPGGGRTYAVSLDKEYTDTLPTFNLALALSDTLIGRFGAAKVMARPKTADLVPSGTCVINDYPTADAENAIDSCNIGNPALEPYRANQFDLSLGWYKNRDTLVNVALFYKDIKSFILARQAVPAFDLFGDGQLYNVTQPINGSGAKIQGLEISAQTAFTFLPAPWDGFGAQANYTYSDARNVGLFDTLTLKELPFPGLSKDSYNLIVYYDKGPVNARLAYNGRSTYMTSVGSGGAPLYRDPTAYLDGKFTYRLGTHYSIFVEGRNLTGEIERSVSGSIRLNDQWTAGKRVFIGFSYKN